MHCRYRAISLQFSMCYLSHLLHERIWLWKWLALLKKVLLIFISRRVRGQLDESSEFHQTLGFCCFFLKALHHSGTSLWCLTARSAELET